MNSAWERRLGAASVIALVVVAGSLLSAGDRDPPVFRCSRAVYPHVGCEAKNVWPVEPVWRVYYKDTNDVVDWERGIVAYITLPQGFYSRFEMCLNEHHCLSAWGGWFGQRLFFRYKPPNECSPGSGQKCVE